MVGIDNISVYDPAGELKRNQDKLLIELNEKLKEKQSTERESEIIIIFLLFLTYHKSGCRRVSYEGILFVLGIVPLFWPMSCSNSLKC